MILIKILISWASAASVHGFQRAHFLARETLQTFFKNGFSLGNLASAHHHHYHDRHAWQDHDASSPNKEVFVRDLAESIRFQTQVPGLPRGLFWLTRAYCGQNPAMNCAATSLKQRIQTDNSQPLTGEVFCWVHAPSFRNRAAETTFLSGVFDRKEIPTGKSHIPGGQQINRRKALSPASMQALSCSPNGPAPLDSSYTHWSGRLAPADTWLGTLGTELMTEDKGLKSKIKPEPSYSRCHFVNLWASVSSVSSTIDVRLTTHLYHCAVVRIKWSNLYIIPGP